MGRAVMAQRYPEARRGRRGARWRGGEEAPDRWGPGVSGGERENAADGRREIKTKTYFAKIRQRRAGRAAVKPVGRGVGGGLGRPAGQGRAGLWPGRLRAEAQWGEGERPVEKRVGRGWAGWVGKEKEKEIH
jgi:hypothetical protein